MENSIQYHLLHDTALKVIKLQESLKTQLVNIYTEKQTDYCKYLDQNTDNLDFMKGLKGVQNNLNAKATQEEIFGENPDKKVSLTKVKKPMITEGLYSKDMLGKYVFHIVDIEPKKQDDFNTAMVKLMKKHNVTMAEMRMAILNEDFQ